MAPRNRLTICILAAFFALGCLYGCGKKAAVEGKKAGYQIHMRDKWYCAALDEGNSIWLAGDAGRIIHSQDNGKTWVMQENKVRKTLFGIDMTPADGSKAGVVSRITSHQLSGTGGCRHPEGSERSPECAGMTRFPYVRTTSSRAIITA